MTFLFTFLIGSDDDPLAFMFTAQNMRSNPGLIEGDIMQSHLDARGSVNSRLWTNGVVPYEIKSLSCK